MAELSTAAAAATATAAVDYVPKNVLITGGAGFIASHVVLRLVRAYPDVKIVNFDRLDYCACVLLPPRAGSAAAPLWPPAHIPLPGSCLANLDEVKDSPNYKFVKGNICSPDLVQYVLRTEAVDTIMHFAAQTHVDNSFGNSFQFTKNNIYGTHVLLESAKVAGNIKRFIHVSTDEVYGEGESMECDPMKEEHILEVSRTALVTIH